MPSMVESPQNYYFVSEDETHCRYTDHYEEVIQWIDEIKERYSDAVWNLKIARIDCIGDNLYTAYASYKTRT